MKKRLLSAFMALALCLTLLPAPAWAAETEGGAAQIGDTVYSTLPDAVNAAQDGDTIKLLADYKTAEGSGGEEESGLTIRKSVTLDLNGHEMDDFRVVQVNDAGETLPSGNLTVEDTSAAKTGKVTGTIELLAGNLTINGGTIGDGRDGVSIENGNLTVNGGTMDCLYGSNSGTVKIAGGTVKNAQLVGDFEITVTGGSGHTGLWNVMEGTWNISGGAFEGVKFLTASPAKNATISGGTFRKITRKILRDNMEVLAPLSGLLADGYAFYQKTDSEEYDRCVKLTDTTSYLENVQVKGHTHNFVNGVCTDCDYACLHTNMDGDDFCPDCNTQMVAKVEVGGTVTYSADFKEAMKAATDGTKITLLADVSISNRTGISGDDTTVTLDLNGHKITGGWLDVGDKDTNRTYTACTLKIIGKGSYEPPMYGGIITVNMKATLDLSEWEGGTINAINISDDSRYEAETREAAVIVGPKAGTIGKLTFGNNQLDELKKTKLSGGSFNEIWAANHQPVKLRDLLADGYAYQYTDEEHKGQFVEYTKTLQNGSIYNVKVVKCLHPNMKPDAATGMTTCEYCGKSGEFAASVDGNLYTDMNEAISYWLENGGTLKLYADYTAATEKATWTIVSGEHSIDLNGHRMSVQGDGSAFKPTNNMHLTVTDGTEVGQIENILLDGSQNGSFTLESGYVGNLEMTGGAVVALKGGRVDKLDVQKNTASTNLSIQGVSLGELNIKDWADGMHVSATSGSLGGYTLPSGKILADVLDHQYYATGTSLDRQVDTAQPTEEFVIKQAPHDFGSATSKAANVPINGRIPFMVDSPSGDATGYYDVMWYRRTDSGAEHMTENRVAGVKVGDTLDVLCVITGADSPGGEMKWQVAVKDYTINVVPADLSQGAVVFTQTAEEFAGTMGNIRDGKGTFVFTPYGGDVNNASTLTYCFEVSHDGQKLIEGKDYTIKSGNTAQYAGDHTLTIQGIGSYTGTATHTWRIEPYKLTRGNYRPPTITKAYDGTTGFDFSKAGNWGIFTENVAHRPNDEKTGKNPVLGAEGNAISIYLKPEDLKASAVTLDSPDVGDRTASYTITLKARDGQREPNFAFEDGGSPTIQVTAPAYITKAFLSSSPEAGELNVANDHAGVYTLDLAALLPALEAPREYGAVTYGAPAVNLPSGYYAVSTAKIENGKLILPIQAVKTDKTGSIGSVEVKVSATNYHEFTLTIDVNATNKIVPTGEPTLSAKTLTYGQALSAIKLSGKLHDNVNNKDIEGTFTWVDDTVKPGAGSYEAAWKFTPTDGDTYIEADGTVTITVNKAKPTGDPIYTKITAANKTLKDAALKPNTSWPTGTIQWVDKDGKELPDTTEVKANTAYKWIFTPGAEFAANYTTATGELTLYSVSTGGGGGGGSSSGSTVKTDTTTKPDGTKVQTETRADGTKIQTETKKDGSTVKTTTNPNGSSVTESKDAAGSTGTVKTDKNGQTEAKTALSSKAIEDAKKSGEPVKAPVEVKATRDSDTAPTVKVELPKGAGETKVEIPVSNVKPGTVAVLVHADGTEEIVKNSLPTEDGIQLTVNGGATVKIVDNSKDFIDTRNHWAKDAIDFVSARGLVNGMNDSIYAPNNSTTRAQLWTILARQNDADLNGGNTWYEKAQLWSKNKGISDGTEPNAAINRAQMVTMLWRAAGSPAAQSGTAFQDVAAGSYYAQAVAWAVEGGITAGVGGGRFDPAATCTRAQIATFLWRAMAE